jgi:predicted transposase YbfD/YdcC
LKGNQAELFKRAVQKLALQKIRGQAPAWESEEELGHGRIEKRLLRLCEYDCEESPLPGLRQFASLTRLWTDLKSGRVKAETRYFALSLEEDEERPARIAAALRGHWSVENKNHWRRDATRWREDRAPRRNPRGAKNLALLRSVLLALLDLGAHDSLNGAFDHYTARPTEALNLLLNATPFPESAF